MLALAAPPIAVKSPEGLSHISSNTHLELPATSVYSPPGAPPLRWWVRVALAGMGLALAILLTTAACLTPSRAGMGTHQQLGLPPCSMVQLLGLRCPACGMTTSWAHLLKGQIGASFRANAGGALLGLAALTVAPWSLLTALRGRWFLVVPRDEWLLTVSLTIAGVTLLDWIIRVAPWR